MVAVSLADILSPARCGLDAVSARLFEVAPDQHPALTAATEQLLARAHLGQLSLAANAEELQRKGALAAEDYK